ncbi:Protein of unknown function DUF2586 [Myroides sp. A21]|uniref:DUF2586 family protein n=1 Tax=Myroides sp. A21 TaxID=1583100 RepID=UPI00058647AC|nr:DUF2586 family protein [Myroides sp. A21]AJA67320.1 Protein of unknown function DUF2586 [Myroides sp. A21]
MAQLAGVNIEKLEGGLQRLAQGTDDHIGMIISVPTTAVEIAKVIQNEGKGIVIKAAYDVEKIGINASFDVNHNVNTYNQIVEFFRLAPTATLYLFNSDKKEDLVSWINQNKEIKGIGLNKVYATGETGEVTTKLKADVKELQLLVNDFSKENRLIDFVCIGADGLTDYTTNLFELEAPHVSVFVSCEQSDKKVSIGSVLGMLGIRKISENLGSVDVENKPRDKRGRGDYPLTDNLLDRWLNSYLPDGRSIQKLDKSELNALIANGYIVAASYEGYPGYFLENSYTCVDRGSDFAQIENNRVWNKAARIIRATLLPRVKSKVKKDPSTGYIATTTVAYWETLLNKALNQLIIDEDISGFDVYIDSKQVVNSTEPVKIKARIVADGIVHEFEVALGLTNNL